MKQIFTAEIHVAGNSPPWLTFNDGWRSPAGFISVVCQARSFMSGP